MKKMKTPPLLFIFFIFVSLKALLVSVTGDNVNAYQPTDDITVNCGDSSTLPVNNPTWIGDAVDETDYSPIDKTRSSIAATTNNSSPSVPGPIPYYTAHLSLSLSEFTYTFHVTAGSKFVRLHFFPSDYLNFRRADSFFSVKAAGYTLLHNFSASLVADYTGQRE